MNECPTCGSPYPHHHPAVQHEGEVHLCYDPWHKPTAQEILAREAAKAKLPAVGASPNGGER
jgi:hypothetical protein